MSSEQFFLTISCLEQVFIWDDEDCDVCFVQDQLSEQKFTDRHDMVLPNQIITTLH